MKSLTGRHGALRVMRLVRAFETLGRGEDARGLREALVASTLGPYLEEHGE